MSIRKVAKNGHRKDFAFRVSYTFGNASSKGAAGARPRAPPAICLPLILSHKTCCCVCCCVVERYRRYRYLPASASLLHPPWSSIRTPLHASVFVWSRPNKSVVGNPFSFCRKNWAGALNFKKKTLPSKASKLEGPSGLCVHRLEEISR